MVGKTGEGNKDLQWRPDHGTEQKNEKTLTEEGKGGSVNVHSAKRWQEAACKVK